MESKATPTFSFKEGKLFCDGKEISQEWSFCSAPLTAEITLTGKEELPMTEHQIEIKEKIDGCQKAIEKLQEEYEQESINAVAERDAYVCYAKYSAFIKAGFSKEQAFAMLNKD